MKKIILWTIVFLLGAAASLFVFRNSIFENENNLSLLTPKYSQEKPLEKYTIESLSNAEIKPGKIEIKEIINEEDKYTSYIFSFEFNPGLEGKTFKKTTGQLNLPSGNGPFPLVVMLRGYINQETYQTGDGTRKAAAIFAENGFITVAPDFLGYAGSDKEAENIFEARFQTYVAVLSLLNSLNQLDSLVNLSDNVGLWGYSNGGQIALTALEITGAGYPTTLWAPVSKPFPYSVLFYTDASEDRGKLIRRELAKFEEMYDVDKYSIDLYLDNIRATLQIHQGTADDAVPVSWSDELIDMLTELNIDLDYYKYPGANHNMVPSWNMVVNRDLEFFNKNLNY